MAPPDDPTRAENDKRHLTLAASLPDAAETEGERPHMRVVPDLPDYPVHAGLPVTWHAWELFPVPHLREKCPDCEVFRDHYIAFGQMPPAPGATFTVDEARPSKRQPGSYISHTVTVPAWPTRRLVAFHCTHCPHQEIYDQDEDFAAVDVDSPTLF